MRKSWWWIGTPIIAGGLGLAGWLATDLLAEDVPLELVAEKDTSKRGGVFKFSRNDKAEAAAEEPAEGDLPAPSRYTRNRPANDKSDAGKSAAGKKVAGKPVKNYYDELFEEPQARPAKAAATPARAVAAKPAATRSARPAPVMDDASLGEPEVRQVRAEKPAPTKTPARVARDASGSRVIDEEVVPAKHETAQGASDREIELVEGRARPKLTRQIPEEPVDPSDDGSRGNAEPLPERVPVRTVAKQPAARSATPPATRTTTSKSLAATPRPEARRAAEPVAEPAPKREPVRTVAAKPLPVEAPVEAPVEEPALPQPKAPVARTTTRLPASPVAKPVPAPVAPPEEQVELTSAAEAPALPAARPAPAAVAPAVAEFDHSAPSGTPAITLRWEARGEVNVGQECACVLIAKNTSKVAARDVVVEAFFPRSVRLIDAQPFPTNTEDHLTWNFENIGAGEEKAIEIKMVPAKRGELATSATVRFTGTSATVLRVEEPQLKVALKGTQSVEIGEAATQTIIVSNPGTGVARDVSIHATIPDGLETSNKGKQVELAIGALAAGETREIKLSLTAVGGGDQLLLVEAKGEGNLISETETAIQVTAPKLDVAATGPSLRYVGRTAQYHIVATNKGAAATNNVRVVQVIPANFEFVKSDKGGVYNQATRTVSWFVGRIEAGESQSLTCELNAASIGDEPMKIEAAGENGALATATVATKVDGTASLVVEIRDLEDPVEVKAETTYEVTIRNDGTKPAQTVALTCELPAGIDLLKVDGPTSATVDRGLLVYKPITSIAPGESQTFKVRVTSKTAGNLRFRTRVSSASIADPLIAEELTKFYAD